MHEALLAELNAYGLAETEASVIVQPEAYADRNSDLSGRSRFRLGLGKLSAFMAACMQPLIPLLVSVGIIRTLATLLGPTMLGLLGPEDGTYRILTIVGNVGIASLPIFMAWSISNYLKTNTVLALIGAFFTFICATGMHTAIIATSLTLIQTQGYDSLALVEAGAAAYACFGVYLALYAV